MTAKKVLTTQQKTQKVLRVNVYSATHAIAPHKRVPALAAPPSRDLFARSTYSIGDGDVVQPPRPGSLDHLVFKSKGNPT